MRRRRERSPGPVKSILGLPGWLREQIARRRNVRSLGIPRVHGMYYNEVLQSARDVDLAVSALGWCHPFRAKTWDVLKMAHFVRDTASNAHAAILDMGCADSPILEILYGNGYRDLSGCDLTDQGIPQLPGLQFHRGTLTHTPFPDGRFRVITCVSVVEHGVPPDGFFAEAHRLLHTGGHLLVSTDYCDPKVETDDVDPGSTFGLPWTIFSRRDIEDLITHGERRGMALIQPVRWESADLPVRWQGKVYTFIFLAFRKE